MSDRIAVSAIIATDEDFSVCRRTIEYLARQTIRERMEMVVVCPDAASLGADPDLLARFGTSTIVEHRGIMTTGELVTAGIRAAAAPYVMYFEEHNFPPPDTLERALEAMEGTDRAALGFAMEPANPGTVAYAHLFLQFGQVAAPIASGEVDRLGGHHALYRKDTLLSYGAELPELMSNEAVLHENLRKNGTRMYVLGDVAIPHVKFSDIGAFLRAEFISQRLYAEARAEYFDWSLLHRALYVGGAPLIPFLRIGRVYRDVRRTGRGTGFFLRILPAATAAACAGALGEAMGYAVGSAASNRATRLNMELDRYAFLNDMDRAGPRAPRQ